LKTGKKPILWSVLALVGTMLLIVPVLNVIALLLLLVPYTVLYTLLNRRSFIVHALAVIIIGCLIIDPIVCISLSLFAMIPSIALGRYYKKGLPSSKIMPKMIGLMIVLLMIGLLLIESMFEVSMLSDISKSFTLMMNDVAAQGISPIAWTAEMTDSFVRLMMNMIPLVFFVMALLIVVCSHYVARRIVSADGVNITPFPRAKDWKLPRSLVFLYFIAYLFELGIDPNDGSFMTLAIMNLVPALSILFAIQAVGFFYYIADNRRWSKAIPFVIAIPVLLFPPASIIGILDTAFPLRKIISKQQ